MPVEIERKFLPASDSWQDQVIRTVRLRDGLLTAEGGRKVRIRIADTDASLTVKGARQGHARDEFEYSILIDHAEQLLANHCDGRILTKTRHFVPEGDLTFEIDAYDGLLAGIVLIEVELASSDQTFPRPTWLGEEVTGRPEYKKINMLRERSESTNG